MAERFAMTIDGRRVVAELLGTDAPNVVRAFTESLPCESFSVHAKFAGEELIVMLPFYCDSENEILDVEPGDIGFYPGRQTACIFYGETRPFGKVSVFAKIVDGLEHLKPAGRRIMAEGPLPVRLELVQGG